MLTICTPHTFEYLASHDEYRGAFNPTLELVVRVDDPIRRRTFDTLFKHTDFASIFTVQRGSGIHVIEGIPYDVAPGDVYIMGVGASHYYTECKDLTLDVIHFKLSVIDDKLRDALAETPALPALLSGSQAKNRRVSGGRYVHLTPDQHFAVLNMMAEMKSEWYSGTTSGLVVAEALFRRLLIFLGRHHERGASALPPGARIREQTIAAAKRVIDDNYGQQIRISEIADAVGLSLWQLKRIFLASAGVTPREYLTQVRVLHAKEMLRNTNLPISDIAWACGFEEPTYFARMFRKETGQTPRQFRSEK
ncbi:MAG: AraC family transcriptional regulator [Capsulimonadaceae bacterium]|nr:AraC family transcriptional regulator [Capsulimonadaceae bacterium]